MTATDIQFSQVNGPNSSWEPQRRTSGAIAISGTVPEQALRVQALPGREQPDAARIFPHRSYRQPQALQVRRGMPRAVS